MGRAQSQAIWAEYTVLVASDWRDCSCLADLSYENDLSWPSC